MRKPTILQHLSLVNFQENINRDELFDKCCLIKIFVEGSYFKWKQKGSVRENIWAEIFAGFSINKLELRIYFTEQNFLIEYHFPQHI